MNRQIGDEAHDAFFEENTIRLAHNEHELQRPELLRNVELDGFIAANVFAASDWLAPSSTIKQYTGLPRLRSLTIASDAVTKAKPGLRRFLEWGLRSVDLTCCALGIFELQMPFGTAARVFFKEKELVSILPKTKLLASTSSVESLVDQINDRHDEISRAYHASGEPGSAFDLYIVIWLKLFELMRDRKAGARTEV